MMVQTLGVPKYIYINSLRTLYTNTWAFDAHQHFTEIKLSRKTPKQTEARHAGQVTSEVTD